MIEVIDCHGNTHTFENGRLMFEGISTVVIYSSAHEVIGFFPSAVSAKKDVK